MNVETLCEKINLRSDIASRVLSFARDFDFRAVDELQKGYFVYERMKDTLDEVQALLGEDPDGVKILACMLKASADAYEVYREKGISDEIYFATMKCFSRFVDETYETTGKACFDRYWWTTREVGCHLFRLGELEYEIERAGEDVFVAIHIPSDANFSQSAVEESLIDSYKFFAEHYPFLNDAEYRCHSWLLDGQLKGMLREESNIISFQNRFEIFDEGEIGSSFIRWIYNVDTTDYNSLPENTSLQRNMKKHLLSGGVIRNARGRLKNGASRTSPPTV